MGAYYYYEYYYWNEYEYETTEQCLCPGIKTEIWDKIVGETDLASSCRHVDAAFDVGWCLGSDVTNKEILESFLFKMNHLQCCSTD